MTQIMTASQQSMTDSQIDNLVDKFRAAVRKHSSEFPIDVVQEVLGVENLGMECLVPFRERVEVQNNLLIRHVPVNRKRTGQEAIEATGRAQHTDCKVLDEMPRGEGEDAKVVFFNPGLYLSDNDLDKEYKLRNLKPVDPYSLAAVNEADPTFADAKPNATHWKDSNGKWCHAAFSQWGGVERGVSVRHSDCDWGVIWWFAGVRE